MYIKAKRMQKSNYGTTSKDSSSPLKNGND